MTPQAPSLKHPTKCFRAHRRRSAYDRPRASRHRLTKLRHTSRLTFWRGCLPECQVGAGEASLKASKVWERPSSEGWQRQEYPGCNRSCMNEGNVTHGRTFGWKALVCGQPADRIEMEPGSRAEQVMASVASHTTVVL